MISPSPVAYPSIIENTESQIRKRLFFDPSAATANVANDTVFTTEIVWRSGPQSLVDRLDYLTSLFPFNMIEIAEAAPGSAAEGRWQIKLHYWGNKTYKVHLLNNFLSLIEPRRKT